MAHTAATTHAPLDSAGGPLPPMAAKAAAEAPGDFFAERLKALAVAMLLVVWCVVLLQIRREEQSELRQADVAITNLGREIGRAHV